MTTQRRSLTEYLEYFRRHRRRTACVGRRGYRRAAWSYGRLLETAQGFAGELEARGIGRGDRVMLWGANSPEWVAAFWGTLLRGAVVVPMDRIAAPDFARRVLAETEARLAVTDRELAAHAGQVPALVLEDLPEGAARHPAGRAGPAAAVAVERSDPAQIIFTSGTTAEPRGVVLSHGNLLANLEPLETEIRKYLFWERLLGPLRFLDLLPLSHVFGQFLGLFVPPLLGAEVHFHDTLNPAELERTIRRERIWVLVAVPRMLETLRDHLERRLEAGGRLDHLRCEMAAAEGKRFWRRWWRFRAIRRRFGWQFLAIVSGGATLDAETEKFWDRLGYAVVQGYGLTETTSLVSVNHPFRLGKGSIGKALPGREIKLGESGEILVRGEAVAAGYWQGRALQPVAGEDGWFATGDVGELGADGHLYFKGRRKNVIVTPQGLNVYPEDLEAALRRQPEVRDAVVIGIERHGNAEPCAALLLRDAAADAAAVVRRANAALADFQHIRRWHVWPEEDFPRTSTQKPRAAAIRQAVEAALGAATAAAPPAAAGSLGELIARVTGRAPAALSPDARLESDLNLSSIDRVELLAAIEDRYQVELNETQMAQATTVGQLERLLRERRPEVSARRTEYVFPRWAQRWPVTWLRAAAYYLLIRPAMRILAPPEIRGRERLREVRGPVLVVSNHVTRDDIGFILAALPARLRRRLAVAMEGERLQGWRRPPGEKNFLARAVARATYFLVVAIFHTFPLPRRSVFRESFAFAGELADRGWSLLVFPEGELTKDGKIAAFEAGIGLLVNNLNLPVVPMRLDGLWELKQAGKKHAPAGFVKVCIGEPIRYPPGAEPQEIAADLRKRVESL